MRIKYTYKFTNFEWARRKIMKKGQISQAIKIEIMGARVARLTWVIQHYLLMLGRNMAEMYVFKI